MMFTLFGQIGQNADSVLLLYWIGMIICLAVLTGAIIIYLYYRKLLERLPDAVKWKNLEVMVNFLEGRKDELDREIRLQKEEIVKNTGVIDEVARAKQWMDDHQLTIEQLMGEITSMRSEYEKVGKLLQETADNLDVKRRELQELDSQLSAKKLQLGDFEEKMARKSELENTISMQEKRIAELDFVLKDIEQLKKNLEGAKDEYERLCREKNTVSAELQVLLLKKDEMSKDIASLNEQNKLLRQTLDRLEKEITDCKSKLDDLKNKIAESEPKLKGLEERSKRAEDLANQLNELRRDKERLSGEVGDLISSRDSKEKQIAHTFEKLSADLKVLQPPDLETRLEDLKRPVIDSTKEIKFRKDDIGESDWLNEFRRQLNSAGIIFPERTIKAFHTGLKIADISPLVVLAGISGTGKSLLPELYARVLGMHFLQISVQPRWDGPQDLFGFYNYMEHRFKATELSRLLWQMDKYNNPPQKANSPSAQLQNSMALVLLDEMNLARVEYYFSDMLSKLETKRTVNPEITAKRSNAEIEIEAGSLSQKEKNPRLFVGNNILFVGTMNEDESTQTLSDKVIDRANMLRFGKPASTDNKPNIDEIREKMQADALLKYDTWAKWQKQELKGNQKEIYDYLTKINTELGKVGRPFGHRVHQAIIKYIANYPGDSLSWKHAFADQIEMKIMPKLNGLELGSGVTDALKGQLESIVDSLQDQPLKDELNKVFDPSRPFFEWKGVSR